MKSVQKLIISYLSRNFEYKIIYKAVKLLPLSPKLVRLEPSLPLRPLLVSLVKHNRMRNPLYLVHLLHPQLIQVASVLLVNLPHPHNLPVHLELVHLASNPSSSKHLDSVLSGNLLSPNSLLVAVFSVEEARLGNNNNNPSLRSRHSVVS